jgi:hypothetical protein
MVEIEEGSRRGQTRAGSSCLQFCLLSKKKKKKNRKEKLAMQRAECWLHWFWSLSGDLLRWQCPRRNTRQAKNTTNPTVRLTPWLGGLPRSRTPGWAVRSRVFVDFLEPSVEAGCLWSGCRGRDNDNGFAPAEKVSLGMARVRCAGCAVAETAGVICTIPIVSQPSA